MYSSLSNETASCDEYKNKTTDHYITSLGDLICILYALSLHLAYNAKDAAVGLNENVKLEDCLHSHRNRESSLAKIRSSKWYKKGHSLLDKKREYSCSSGKNRIGVDSPRVLAKKICENIMHHHILGSNYMLFTLRKSQLRHTSDGEPVDIEDDSVNNNRILPCRF
nr:unnamed protein product [Callosobruchus analis]